MWQSDCLSMSPTEVNGTVVQYIPCSVALDLYSCKYLLSAKRMCACVCYMLSLYRISFQNIFNKLVDIYWCKTCLNLLWAHLTNLLLVLFICQWPTKSEFWVGIVLNCSWALSCITNQKKINSHKAVCGWHLTFHSPYNVKLLSSHYK